MKQIDDINILQLPEYWQNETDQYLIVNQMLQVQVKIRRQNLL